MKNSKKSVYKRLNELSLVIASNLSEVDEEYLGEVNQIIKNTRVSNYYDLFEDARKYFQVQKKMPDFEYVEMYYPDLIEDLKGEEAAWHESFPQEYISLLEKDSMLQDIIKATAKEDLEEVDQILTSNEKIFHDDITGKLPDWDDLWKAYETIKCAKTPLKWGVRELDELYNGLCYGTLNILAAPPGKFKTTSMISVAKTNMNEGKKVLYITLEDSWDIIYFNLAARESYEQDRLINASNMKIGQLDEEDESVLKEVIEDCKRKFKDCFRAACQQSWKDFSPSGLLRLIRKAKKEMGGLDLVIMDHASLMKFYKVKGIIDPKETINFYIRFLTNLSISFEEKFALLVAMQTNRDGIKELESGKTGSLTNLAEANEAERSASTVTLIYSGPNAVESNIINFYPKKNRRGSLSVKPIISFIEPAAYFVGERAVAGDISLDDLMEDMIEDTRKPAKKSLPVKEEFIEEKEIESKVKTKKKSLGLGKSNNSEEDLKEEKPKKELVKRRMKILNGRTR